MRDWATTREPLLYILSAGRSGTKFLEKVIAAHCQDVRVEHEPFPTRYILMLGNVRNEYGLFRGLVSKLHHWHQSRLHNGNVPYIEINPFLCPVTEEITISGRPIRIVHMVRNPGDWSQSISTFKASKSFRWLIDYIPFSKPYPAPRPENWKSLSVFEKGLHRWNWCNSRIAALEQMADKYLLVKAENLFNGTYEEKSRILFEIFDTLNLTAPEAFDSELLSRKVNPAPPGKNLINLQAVKIISGDLARKLGYEV